MSFASSASGLSSIPAFPATLGPEKGVLEKNDRVVMGLMVHHLAVFKQSVILTQALVTQDLITGSLDLGGIAFLPLLFNRSYKGYSVPWSPPWWWACSPLSSLYFEIHCSPLNLMRPPALVRTIPPRRAVQTRPVTPVRLAHLEPQVLPARLARQGLLETPALTKNLK